MASLSQLWSVHRARLARLVMLGGALAVALTLAPAVPRTVDVDVVLGPEHREFVEVRLAYLRAGEELQGVRFSFPGGAPSRVHHSVRLPQGDFEVVAELRDEHGRAEARSHRLRAPAEGVVVIRMQDRQP